jgi:hypothetical protein
MAKQVKRRRGTTAEHDVFTGAIGEITVDTTVNTVVIHDGTTLGGHPLGKADGSNIDLSNRVNVNELATADGTAGYILTTDGSGQISFSAPGGVTPNSVGALELDTADGLAGTVLTTDGGGTLTFAPVSVGIDELECNEGTAGQVLTTDGNGTISFNNAFALGANSVGITELDVLDGSPGQVLATNGSGDLSFVTAATGGGAGGSSVFIEDIFTGDNTTTTFNLSTAAPSEETILLFIDGVAQPTSAYTLPTTTSINLSSAPATGASIKVLHLGIASALLDDSVTTNILADNSVTKVKMADDAVSIAELDVTDGTNGQVLKTDGAGNLGFTTIDVSSTAVGGDLSGTISNASIVANAIDGTHIAMGSDLAGDILYHNGTNYVRLPKGTADQILIMNTGATAPEWGTASSGYFQDVFILQDPADTSVYLTGTWTKPTGVRWMEYLLIGAGGKGGSGHVNSGTQLAATGGAGGFGGRVMGKVSPEEMSTITSVAYTIGRGWTGHNSTGAFGNGVTAFGQCDCNANSGVTPATAVPVVTNGVITGVTVTPGSTNNVPNTTGIPCRVLINYNATTGAGGTGAVITANVNGSGSITSCTIVNGGTGYVQNETQICIGLGWAGMGYNGGNGTPGSTGGEQNEPSFPSTTGSQGANGNDRSMGSNNNVIHADFGARDALGQPQPHFQSAQALGSIIEGSGGQGSGGTVPAHWFGYGGLIHLRLYK